MLCIKIITRNQKILDATYSCFQALQTLPKINQFRGRDKDNIQFLNDNARKFEVLDKNWLKLFNEYNSKGHTSSFSRISAKVRYIFSVLRFRQSCLMMRLPRVSKSRLSVLKSSSRLFIKALKYVSSELEEI